MKSINDVDNASSAGGPTPEVAPDFLAFKFAADSLDRMHTRRDVEITHVPNRDEIAGLDQLRKYHQQPEGKGKQPTQSILEGTIDELFEIQDSEISGELRQLIRKSLEGKKTSSPDLGALAQELTKSESERQLGVLTREARDKLTEQVIVDHFEKALNQDGSLSDPERKEFLDEIRKLLPEAVAKMSDSNIDALLKPIFESLGADSEPFAKKLFSQIREGMTAPRTQGYGSDQVVLRFAADALDDQDFEIFRSTFKLRKADKEHPFYNIQRADWGQLRRRDSQNEFKRKGEIESENENDSEIRLWASVRSFLEVMYFLAQGTCIPEEHYEQGLVTVTRNYDGSAFDWSEVTGDMFQVCVSSRKPQNASTAVKYRGYWYYIQDNDQRSKATFTLLMQMYNMSVRSGAVGQVPALTIPL